MIDFTSDIIPDSVSSPGHILIVEDSDTQAMRLRLYLEAAQWIVTRAATGKEVRELLHLPAPECYEEEVGTLPEPRFDLVLLDYHLPDTSGDVLCREIRAWDHTRQLPILMLTGSERQETELETLRSGADDYVSKSIGIEIVLARLNALLQKARARAELSTRYERERRVAQVLQESMLSAPPDNAFPGMSFQVVYESAWEEAHIGGDFYDLRALGEGWVALVVGDVTGKGLEAATFTAEVRYALRTVLYQQLDPGVALEKVNDFLSDSSERNPWSNRAFVAVSLALYNTITGEVRIATGGIEPPLLLHRDASGSVTATEVTGSRGPLLGAMSGLPFETKVLSLEPNDILMLFTDGITEARQRRGEMLGYEAMAEIARIAYESKEGTTETVVTAVRNEAKRISGEQLLDDICILAVQRL